MKNGLADPSDPLLVERCLHNDNDAWYQLQQRYRPLVRAAIQWYLEPFGSPAYLVEQLTEEFWGYLWEEERRRLGAYQRVFPLPPFLRKLAKDSVCAYLRQNRLPKGKRLCLSNLRLPNLSITYDQVNLVVEEAWPRLPPRLQRRLRYLLGMGEEERSGRGSPKNPRDEDSRLRCKLRALFCLD
ncbi:MAG: hypothetical protein L0Z62_33970 [Gemmataceae bacterium]|nr:hypothetical protein [Gemmataceae bacterium]